jgi:hypothetical protein
LELTHPAVTAAAPNDNAIDIFVASWVRAEHRFAGDVATGFTAYVKAGCLAQVTTLIMEGVTAALAAARSEPEVLMS